MTPEPETKTAAAAGGAGNVAASGGAGTVAVIGAGIVGVSAAIWLQRAGFSVVLIDKAGPAEGTSYGNAGMLACAAVAPVTTPDLLRKIPRMLADPDQPLFMRWRHFPAAAPWLLRLLRHANAKDSRRIAAALHGIVGDSLHDHQALAAGTPAAKWIVPCDYLFAYQNRARFADEDFAWGLRRDHGFEWEELEGSAVQNYEPALSPAYAFAARLEGHGRIADPGRYVKDLAAHAVAGGARLLRAEVTDIVLDQGRVTGVRAGGETVACDAAVLAAGVWSANLARRLGVDAALESERGYHLELWSPSHTLRAPVMITSGRFIATPMEGRLRLGGVVEYGGLDAPPSKAPPALLRRHAARAFPGLSWSETREWMGHRPSTPDSLPLIGEIEGARGAYCAFGHQHVGLTGGPKTGRIVAQLISGAKPNVDLAPYAPGRFTSVSRFFQRKAT
ncbi:MAG: NAD(P)/FAD-dependent oxidoreductase [Rhodospirillales bacterium]